MIEETGEVMSARPPAADAVTREVRTPLELAIAIQEARRRRRVMFPHAEAIFHEPAWDMLLDLFVVESQGRDVVFEQLCDSANVRTATALRWITTLEQLGLVQATAALQAGPPILSLTCGGRAAMLAYLSNL